MNKEPFAELVLIYGLDIPVNYSDLNNDKKSILDAYKRLVAEKGKISDPKEKLLSGAKNKENKLNITRDELLTTAEKLKNEKEAEHKKKKESIISKIRSYEKSENNEENKYTSTRKGFISLNGSNDYNCDDENTEEYEEDECRIKKVDY